MLTLLSPLSPLSLSFMKFLIYITYTHPKSTADISSPVLIHPSRFAVTHPLLHQLKRSVGIYHGDGSEPYTFKTAVKSNCQFRVELIRRTEANKWEIAWRNWLYREG